MVTLSFTRKSTVAATNRSSRHAQPHTPLDPEEASAEWSRSALVGGSAATTHAIQLSRSRIVMDSIELLQGTSYPRSFLILGL